jgi:hypothetical protein
MFRCEILTSNFSSSQFNFVVLSSFIKNFKIYYFNSINTICFRPGISHRIDSLSSSEFRYFNTFHFLLSAAYEIKTQTINLK